MPPITDPTVRASKYFTFSQVDVQRGFFDLRLSTILDGFRVRYINGTEAQSSFLLDAVLRTQPESGFFNEGNVQVTGDFLTEVALQNISNYSTNTKFGRNPQINTGTPEDIWPLGGDYTGFNATANENIEALSSSANDAGTLVSSGTATGGSSTTLVDSGATFVSDGVAVGDVVINDTQGIHGIITSVDSETQVTVYNFRDTALGSFATISGDTYRIATPASTGAAVIKVTEILNSDFERQLDQYIILNGTSGVTATVDAYRSSRAYVIKAGSNDGAVGNITIRQATTTANVFNYIAIGFNQSLLAAYTIPKDANNAIKDFNVSISRANGSPGSASIALLTREFGGVFRARRAIDPTVGGPIPEDIKGGLITGEGTDIKVRALSVSDNNTIVSANFEFVEIRRPSS